MKRSLFTLFMDCWEGLISKQENILYFMFIIILCKRCVVLENIQILTIEATGNSGGVGGSMAQEIL